MITPNWGGFFQSFHLEMNKLVIIFSFIFTLTLNTAHHEKCIPSIFLPEFSKNKKSG